MNLFHASVATLILTSAHAADPPLPKSWAEFQVSTNKEDKALVASIKKMDWWNVCKEWGREARKKQFTRRRAALAYFLNDGKYINGVDMTMVSKKSVEIGMTACGVFASLGIPDDINQTKTAWRTSAQLVYRDRGMYIYTEGEPGEGNGIVRSIQD